VFCAEVEVTPQACQDRGVLLNGNLHAFRKEQMCKMFSMGSQQAYGNTLCACMCLYRANNAAVKLAGLQSALAVMCAPTPAIAAPPSAASPEVKALASKEEAAMVALSR
jgi:hypothetical protein